MAHAKGKLGRRRILKVPKKARVVWTQEDWNKLIPIMAQSEVANGQIQHPFGFGRRMMDAQIKAGFGEDKQRPNVKAWEHVPAWFREKIMAKKRQLLSALNSVTGTASVTEVPPVATQPEIEPTHYEMLIENQERLEAILAAQQQKMDNIFTLILGIVTTKPDEIKDLAKDQSISSAIANLEKPHVLVMNVNPGHDAILQRMYSPYMHLRIIEQGKTLEAMKSNGLGRPDYVIVARNVGGTGVSRVVESTGKHPHLVQGTSSVKKLLTALVAGQLGQPGTNGGSQAAH